MNKRVDHLENIYITGLPYGMAGKEPEGKSRHIYHLNVGRNKAMTDSECGISRKQWECSWHRMGGSSSSPIDG